MAGRCGCAGGCQCTIQPGANTLVTGNGSPDNPYTIALVLPDTSSNVTQAQLDAALAGYAPLSIYAAAPDLIAVGAIARSSAGAAIGFSVSWPDGAVGDFAGVESVTFPGAIDSYTVTHYLGGVTVTYTQPTLTRNSSGAVVLRPKIVVS